jgi:hypothetical protein
MVALASPIPRAPRSYAPTTQSPPDSCACARTYNLQVEQGATLSTKITLMLNQVPVDLTGAWFQFTAKLDPDDLDSALTTVMVDWQETVTSLQGYTWLVVSADVTGAMQLAGYSYQVRMVSAGGVVTPIVKGVFTIVQPVSSRHNTSGAVVTPFV